MASHAVAGYCELFVGIAQSLKQCPRFPNGTQIHQYVIAESIQRGRCRYAPPAIKGVLEEIQIYSAVDERSKNMLSRPVPFVARCSKDHTRSAIPIPQPRPDISRSGFDWKCTQGRPKGAIALDFTIRAIWGRPRHANVIQRLRKRCMPGKLR
jgi:hypothetical protein